jgi:serine/threonine protein kinase
MRCSACGQDSADQDRFCASCGTPLPISSEPEPSAHEASESSPPSENPAAKTSKTAPSAPLSFGSGRYQVVRLLGEGGSKIVYLARDNLLDREIALALIKVGSLDEQQRARITREAQAMAKLGDHPNIVTIYDVGEDAGRPYIVTQYMAGGSVDDLLRKSPHHHLPNSEAIRIADEICQALEYAHGLGIVHRDLKPGNVWLTKEGVSKLGDFGLALGADQPRLTVTGLVAGTVAYMSPEQAMGKSVDARSDLYSLGAMLYEMVTGRPPFLGDNIATVISQLLNSEPLRPSQLLPGVAPALDRLILKLLAKSADDRCSDAATVRHELSALNQGIDQSQTGAVKSADIALTVARNLSQLNLHEAPDGTVSLFFSDIEGSTAMWERLGDLKAVEVLHAHDSIVRKQVESHQGFVANTTGDGFFVTFKTVRQALLCAIEIQRDLVAYGRSHPDQPLRIRIGLHVGEARRESNDYHGNAVNFAARVMSHADGGEIATSASFMDLAKDAGDIRFDHGREVALKGFPDTYRIYRVAWNVTDHGEWLCPNCTRAIPAAQRSCVACAEAPKPTPTQSAIPPATLSPIAAASAPLQAAVARSPVIRALTGAAVFVLMAAASFAGVYLYQNHGAHPQPVNLASIGQAPHPENGHNSIAPKREGEPYQGSTSPNQGSLPSQDNTPSQDSTSNQNSNVAEIASLGFTSMSLEPCNNALPIAIYTKDLLSSAGCIKWSARFSHYPEGLQSAGNTLEVTVYDPNDQEVTHGASDSLSGDPQSGGRFDGSVAIPDMTGYPTGQYMTVLSAGGMEIAERPFYVVPDAEYQNIDFEHIDVWEENVWIRDHPRWWWSRRWVRIEPRRRPFFVHGYRRAPLIASREPFDRNLSEPRSLSEHGNLSEPRNPSEPRARMFQGHDGANPFKAAPAKAYANPFVHESPTSSNPRMADAPGERNPFVKSSAERQSRPNSPFSGGARAATNPFGRQLSPYSRPIGTMPVTTMPRTGLPGTRLAMPVTSAMPRAAAISGGSSHKK